jgi:hypothetical protein
MHVIQYFLPFIPAYVGADLSRPAPIYRPSLHVPLAGLLNYCAFSTHHSRCKDGFQTLP